MFESVDVNFCDIYWTYMKSFNEIRALFLGVLNASVFSVEKAGCRRKRVSEKKRIKMQ